MHKLVRAVGALLTRVRGLARAKLTRSNVRDVIELAGFGLIVAAAFQLNVALGLFVAGVALVVVGNFA